jgi:hypothetical protein
MNQQKKRGRPANVRQEQSIEAEAVNDQREIEIEGQPVEDDSITLVRRVEMEIGRTSNAWGMVDPLELIDAVDRVLRGGEA